MNVSFPRIDWIHLPSFWLVFSWFELLGIGLSPIRQSRCFHYQPKRIFRTTGRSCWNEYYLNGCNLGCLSHFLTHLAFFPLSITELFCVRSSSRQLANPPTGNFTHKSQFYKKMFFKSCFSIVTQARTNMSTVTDRRGAAAASKE